MTHDLLLEVRTHPRHLAAVRGLVGGWLACFELGEDVEHSIVLAVDEACSNCIRHAYGGRGNCYARLTMRETPEFLEFEISDEGTPCRPEKVVKRDLLPPEPDEVTPGGLGVQLMHQVFDEVIFDSGSPLGNRVTLRLRKPL
jgi:anti-sigma regulatory factor (Ser/Thr protein kinase)